MPKQGDRWLEFHLVRSSDSAQQLLIVRDVTSEARLESMRRDFVANASHELRSPLTVVRGYLDSLAEDPVLDPGWREPVREMQRQSERMHSIVSDLLELSRLEAGRSDAEMEPIDVAGLLSLMRKEVLSRPDRPAKFDLSLESDALLLGGESELHSIFQNLITNPRSYGAFARVLDYYCRERGLFDLSEAVRKMTSLPADQIGVGTDGCSAPNFALPLRNAAWGYARLCNPEASKVTPSERVIACQTNRSAMTTHPDMVSGPGHFETCLMEATGVRLVSKGGAEGYQGIGVMPGALGPGSPAAGIAINISDGDQRSKVRAAVALEVLRQLDMLNSEEMQALTSFGPRFPVFNWQKIPVGEARPNFRLNVIG